MFRALKADFAPGIDVDACGWAAETARGWTGLVVDGRDQDRHGGLPRSGGRRLGISWRALVYKLKAYGLRVA